MRTAENLIRHELIGLDVSVCSSRNKQLIGKSGNIVDETKNMFILRDNVKLQKSNSMFKFKIKKRYVILNGADLVSQPEDRLKKKMKVRIW